MMIDREMFVRYLDGELITRTELALFVANETACEAAIQAAESGETVFMSVKGKPYSKLVNKKEVLVTIDEYQEHQRKEWDEP